MTVLFSRKFIFPERNKKPNINTFHFKKFFIKQILPQQNNISIHPKQNKMQPPKKEDKKKGDVNHFIFKFLIIFFSF